MKQNDSSDITSGNSILFVGPLPPPVHGAANINRKVLDALSRRLSVRVCDQSPGRLIRGPGYYIRRLYNVCLAILKILRNSVRKYPKLYMSIDGGLGLLFNIIVLTFSRITGHNLTLHHHSFAYINRRSQLFALLTAVAGNHATHICLCESMERKLKRLYSSIRKTMVVPNFIEDTHNHAKLRKLLSAPQITIGHLSNLSIEKGLLEFLDLLRNGISGPRHLKGVLAGPPATNEVARLIDAAEKEFGDALDYRGPVYGEQKDQFFRDIDTFIFPTNYYNEAQPIVIAEAMSYGIPIVSYDRGCIRDTLSNYMSLVIDQNDDFLRLSVEALVDWHENAFRKDYRNSNIRYYESILVHHQQRWRLFVNYLSS